MIECHIHPDEALSDAKQQITPKQLCSMVRRLHTRSAELTDREVKRRISRLRTEISQVDARLIKDLAERMRWVEEIGRLKQQHNIAVLQLHRWENLLGDHVSKAEKAGLDPEFVKSLFEIIHAQAIKRQL
jgi:chorismate mutase